MSASQDEHFRAATLGMIHALQVAIRAICLTHPNKDALIEALKHEHHESMSLLLAKPLPDVTIEAYKDILWGCTINSDDWIEP